MRYRKNCAFDANGYQQEITVAHEKGIDVRLALDIISCAVDGQFDVAVICSQDQDLSEVVKDVRSIATRLDREIGFACAFPSGPNATSRRGIDKTDWIKIEQSDYDQWLDPKTTALKASD